MNYGDELSSLSLKFHKLRTAVMYKELKEFDLTSPQLFILMELFHGQPKKLSDLAKAVDLSNSTVSGIVDRLENKGLVERKRDEEDRRVVWINTTMNCQQMKQNKLEKFQKEFQNEFLEFISPEQQDILIDLFRKLIVLMEKRLEEKA